MLHTWPQAVLRGCLCSVIFFFWSRVWGKGGWAESTSYGRVCILIYAGVGWDPGHGMHTVQYIYILVEMGI